MLDRNLELFSPIIVGQKLKYSQLDVVFFISFGESGLGLFRSIKKIIKRGPSSDSILTYLLELLLELRSHRQ